jgi:3-methyl-2-oxobutanoate hydroxymethyltransferase
VVLLSYFNCRAVNYFRIIFWETEMETKITIAELLKAKNAGEKIAAVSCYDYTTAKLVSETPIQLILVGDSAAQMILVTLTAAVRRGAPNVYLVADMPFLSYQLGTIEAIKNAGRFVIDSGAQMVKIEASGAYLDVIKSVSDAGIAVMAHIGIRPQTISKIGKFKAEATTAEMGLELISLAEQMIQAGASALLLEGAAGEVAEIITKRSQIPVIGCGSGPGCDGQILIAPDILGLTQSPGPKFAKKYGNLGRETIKAFENYSAEVRAGQYPSSEYSYHMKPGEQKRLQKLLDDNL